MSLDIKFVEKFTIKILSRIFQYADFTNDPKDTFTLLLEIKIYRLNLE